MGRKKLNIKKIENSAARQVTYSKRKNGIMKKAKELGILCGIDVGVIMFSPSGRVSTFASNGRVDDVFLRLLAQPDGVNGCYHRPAPSNELLVKKLRQLRLEAEMLEKIVKIEELEENLEKLKQRQRDANEKIKYYELDVEQINSVREAEVHQQFLERAMHRIQLAKTKLLGKELDLQYLKNAKIHYSQVAAITEEGEASTANQSVHIPQTESIQMEEPHQATGLPTGPNQSSGFRSAQNDRCMSRSQQASNPSNR